MFRTLPAVMIAFFMLAGCTTTSDGARSFERGPDKVMGSPPSESSEDYEFAPPPRHPGPHGEVENTPRRASTQPREPGVIRRGELQRFMEFGPSVVWEHVDTEPQHESGRFQGFMIVDLSRGAHEVLSPEVRVGDVITHINLVRLERPDHYMEIWEELPRAEEIRIDFLRDGEAMNATWQVR